MAESCSNGEHNAGSLSSNPDHNADIDPFSRFLSLRQHGSGTNLTCVQRNASNAKMCNEEINQIRAGWYISQNYLSKNWRFS